MEIILISAVVSFVMVIVVNTIIAIRKRKQQLAKETQADWNRFWEAESQHQRMVQQRGWVYSIELTYDELNRRNHEEKGWIDINALLDIYAMVILKITQVPQEELERLKNQKCEWTPFHADISFGPDNYVVTARRYQPKDFIRRVK